MALWHKLVGMREQTELGPAMALDLARLKQVAGGVGANPSFKFRFLDADRQLRQLNCKLGERLAGSKARDRQSVVNAFAAADQTLPPTVRNTVSTIETPEIRKVRETGCADLGRTLTDAQLQAIHAHLKAKPVLLGHDAHAAADEVASIDAVPADKNYACYDYLDLWSSPHILELASQDRFLDLAQAYLGCTPTLYSINAFWSFPNRQPNKASQVFHRDWEDYRSLVIFTLLTPVEVPEEGAHYYVEASHEVGRFEERMRKEGASGSDVENLLVRDETVIAPTAMRLFEHSAQRFDGPAGRSFCGDGYGLHRAMVPRSRPRLLLWMRFGNFYNETMYRMSLRHPDRPAAERVLARIPATPRHRYVFRYMVEALSRVP
ncbi:MAG TPA: hypothetical protein VFB13_06310 [Reyranella sp.]|jgi:hypothetical protein|nr:hypothetical protein [Reyranella sp.]